MVTVLGPVLPRFEFSISEMPEYWKQTQEKAREFFKLNSNWLIENVGFSLSKTGLAEDPDTFTILVPVDSRRSAMKTLDNRSCYQVKDLIKDLKTCSQETVIYAIYYDNDDKFCERPIFKTLDDDEDFYLFLGSWKKSCQRK